MALDCLSLCVQAGYRFWSFGFATLFRKNSHRIDTKPALRKAIYRLAQTRCGRVDTQSEGRTSLEKNVCRGLCGCKVEWLWNHRVGDRGAAVMVSDWPGQGYSNLHGWTHRASFLEEGVPNNLHVHWRIGLTQSVGFSNHNPAIRRVLTLPKLGWSDFVWSY